MLIMRNLIVTVDNDTKVEDSLHKLWDLETLGIRPVDEVHATTIDNIEFTGERFSIKLP